MLEPETAKTLSLTSSKEQLKGQSIVKETDCEKDRQLLLWVLQQDAIGLYDINYFFTACLDISCLPLKKTQIS